MFQKTQIYNDVLERNIRKHPEQWLWLHRRWKDYRGVPRWQPKGAMALALLLLSLMGNGCATTGQAPTGIALPPDPKIDVPRFKAQVSEEGSGSPAVPTPSPGTIIEMKAESLKSESDETKKDAKKKKNRRKKMKAKASDPSAPAKRLVNPMQRQIV